MPKMRRTLTYLLTVFFVFCLALSSSLAQKGGRSSSKSSSKSSIGKTVHVKGYTRKDGTYVPPYDRAAPGTASSSSSSSGSSSRTIGTERDKHGRIKRSAAAKHEFMLTHPCPATGRTSGKCPGYVVDHILPLACGGSDSPSNMQWQSKADAKVKDKLERKGC